MFEILVIAVVYSVAVFAAGSLVGAHNASKIAKVQAQAAADAAKVKAVEKQL